MTTNDRRKTFNTPLEFWQWAIMEPGKRKARQTHGTLFWCETLDLSGAVCCINDSMQRTALTITMCPLTAVEDEHGAIEESRTSDDLTKWLEELAHCAVTKDVQEIFSAASSLAHEIRKHIDERIAAATVEWHGPHGNWAVDHNCRLKPKGDK